MAYDLRSLQVPQGSALVASSPVDTLINELESKHDHSAYIIHVVSLDLWAMNQKEKKKVPTWLFADQKYLLWRGYVQQEMLKVRLIFFFLLK